MATNPILTRSEMKSFYGDFWSQSPGVRLSAEKVPPSLVPLIPYAEFWGVTDDLLRENLVDAAPKPVAQNMKDVVYQLEPIWESWLGGRRADPDHPTDEFLAFAALIMAADYV